MNNKIISFVNKYKYITLFVVLTASFIYSVLLKNHEDSLLRSDSNASIGYVYEIRYQISKGKHYVFYSFVVNNVEYKGYGFCRTARVGEYYEVIYYRNDPDINHMNFKKKLHR